MATTVTEVRQARAVGNAALLPFSQGGDFIGGQAHPPAGMTRPRPPGLVSRLQRPKEISQHPHNPARSGANTIRAPGGDAVVDLAQQAHRRFGPELQQLAEG